MHHSLTIGRIRLQMAPDKIYILKFILEGYDNLAILSTIDQQQGLVEIRFPAEAEPDILHVLKDMQTDIKAELIDQLSLDQETGQQEVFSGTLPPFRSILKYFGK